jgi:hypothetical protein
MFFISPGDAANRARFAARLKEEWSEWDERHRRQNDEGRSE